MLTVHGRKNPRKAGPKETCPRCKRSVLKSNMTEHMLGHERCDVVVLNCSHCEYTTNDRRSLNGKYVRGQQNSRSDSRKFASLTSAGISERKKLFECVKYMDTQNCVNMALS